MKKIGSNVKRPVLIRHETVEVQVIQQTLRALSKRLVVQVAQLVVASESHQLVVVGQVVNLWREQVVQLLLLIVHDVTLLELEVIR